MGGEVLAGARDSAEAKASRLPEVRRCVGLRGDRVVGADRMHFSVASEARP